MQHVCTISGRLTGMETITALQSLIYLFSTVYINGRIFLFPFFHAFEIEPDMVFHKFGRFTQRMYLLT
jgi:hypothetical protein